MKKKPIKKLALQRSTVSNLNAKNKLQIRGGIIDTDTDTFPRRSCIYDCPVLTADTCNTNCGQATCVGCTVSCAGTCGAFTCADTCTDTRPIRSCLIECGGTILP